MLKLLPVLALISLGFTSDLLKSEPEPLFKSPRKFYRSGDTVQVTIEKDTTIDVAFCAKGGIAVFYYKVEQLAGDQWISIYQTQTACPATAPSIMEAKKGFTIKHPNLDKGIYRMVVSSRFYSSKFEVR